LVNAITAGLVVAGYEGAFAFAWRADSTKVSFVTLGAFAILTMFIGHLTFRRGALGRDEAQDRRHIRGCWFAADALMTLGLAGTVAGLLLMFQGAAGGLDPGNVSLMRTAILQLSTGLTTSFVTTLSGVITSLLAKALLVSYDVDNPAAPEGD
jgi:hypothetical protein